MISFTVCDLEPINFPNNKSPESSTKKKIERLLGGGEIETCSDFDGKVTNGGSFTEILANSLAEASFSSQHLDPDTNFALRPKVGWAIRDVSNIG